MLVREVCLRCDGRPVVFAHSVVDRRTLCGPWRMLDGLGARPLGAALFDDPRVERGPLRFARLGSGHELAQRARAVTDAAAATLWARRSLFLRQGAPLLVTEVFLPAIGELAA